MLREVRRGRSNLRNRLLARKSKLFFIDRIRDLCSLSKEIKIFSHRFLVINHGPTSSKSVIVEHIVRLIQLITETIIGILEIKTSRMSVGVKGEENKASQNSRIIVISFGSMESSKWVGHLRETRSRSIMTAIAG